MFKGKNEKGISLVILILIIVLILVVGGVIIGVVIMNKNKNKEPITPEQFKSTMEDMGYLVKDVKEQFKNYDYVKAGYISMDKEYKYQIEFYELDTEKNAIYFYNINKSKFENSKSLAATNTEIALGNNSKYVLKSNGQYRSVSRIENTCIYIDVDEEYKDEVKEILKVIGY